MGCALLGYNQPAVRAAARPLPNPQQIEQQNVQQKSQPNLPGQASTSRNER
jgi:hypothetical protein